MNPPAGSTGQSAAAPSANAIPLQEALAQKHELGWGARILADREHRGTEQSQGTGVAGESGAPFDESTLTFGWNDSDIESNPGSPLPDRSRILPGPSAQAPDQVKAQAGSHAFDQAEYYAMIGVTEEHKQLFEDNKHLYQQDVDSGFDGPVAAALREHITGTDHDSAEGIYFAHAEKMLPSIGEDPFYFERCMKLRKGGVSVTDIKEHSGRIEEYLNAGANDENIGYCLRHNVSFEKISEIGCSDLPDLVEKDDTYWQQFAEKAENVSAERAKEYAIKDDKDQSAYGGSRQKWLKWMAHTVDEAGKIRKERGFASLDTIDQFIARSRATAAINQGTKYPERFGTPRFNLGFGKNHITKSSANYFKDLKKRYDKYLGPGEQTVSGCVGANLFGRELALTRFCYLNFQNEPRVEWMHTYSSPHIIKLHCRLLFQEAMMKDIPQDKLTDLLAELVYFRSHLMEWKRGSAAITEQLLHYIVQFHGGSIQLEKMVDCIALTTPTVGEFQKEFREMVNGQELIKPQMKTKTDHERLCEDCRRGNLEKVQNWLQNSNLKPGDIDTIKDAAGYSPIHLAALSGNAGLVDFLLSSAKANPNLQTDSGETPVLLAATKGNGEAVSLLLDYGASVNPIPTLGVTPLHIGAGTIADKTVIEKMLAKGAGPLIKDWDGALAEEFASGADNKTIYECLREKVELPADPPEPTDFKKMLTRSAVDQMWLCKDHHFIITVAEDRLPL